MTRQVFTLPDLGEGLTEAELVRWLVELGDTIAVDHPIAEVETAKATVEVPSPYGGVVVQLHGQPGAVLNVGAPLLTVDDQTKVAPTTQLTGAPAADRSVPTSVEARSASSYVAEERAGSGNVLVGYGTAESLTADRGRRGRRARRCEEQRAAAGEAALPRRDELRAAGPVRVRSPLVRDLARQRGVALHDVAGSGQGGLITRADVERAAADAVAVPHLNDAAQGADRAPDEDPGADGRTGLAVAARIPLRGVRKAIATALVRSRKEIPEATTWVDADVTGLLDLREALSTLGERGPGLLALLARFVVAGLARYPELNARVDDGNEQILHLHGVNLGIATQTTKGLVVPSVRNAHLLSARLLDAEIRRLVHAAREGTATAAELSSGSFTLNNYGSLGVDGSAAIINHPEVAILGMGRVFTRPWVVDGQIAPRPVAQLSLVFDHRVCDGGTAGGFLRFVADAVETPTTALADL